MVKWGDISGKASTTVNKFRCHQSQENGNCLPPAVGAEEGVWPGAELRGVPAPPAGAQEVPEGLQLRPPVGEPEVVVWQSNQVRCLSRNILQFSF